MVVDLTKGPVVSTLLRFAMPMFFASLLQTLYGMVDMIVVGQVIGSSGLSGVSIGTDLNNMLMFIALSFSSAGGVHISQAIGAGDTERVKDIIGCIFTFLFMTAIAMTTFCLIMIDRIIVWINAPVESAQYAKEYLIVCALGLFFIYGYNCVSAILRSMGDSSHPFIFIAVATVINLILDILFVVVLQWEVRGAALATVIAQSVSFIYAIIFLYRRKEFFCFDFKLSSFRIKKQVFIPIIKLGLPMMLQFAAVDFSKLCINSWINTYGVISSALTGVGNKLSSFVSVFTGAFSSAACSMIGQSIGARKYDRVSKVVFSSFACCLPIAIAMCIWNGFFPKTVFGIFTSEAAVLERAAEFVPVAILLYLGCALRPPMLGLIEGVGNYKLNFVVALLDGIIIRIGLSYYLGIIAGVGLHGFWYGAACASLVPFFVGIVYFISGTWKTDRYVTAGD